MNEQSERQPSLAISGTWVRLSERESIAIYRLNDVSWVAHFRDGCAELCDAAMWFKSHAGMLRSHWVGSPSALRSVEMLTPEMVARIARLHQRAAAERGRRDAVSAALVAALRGAFAQAVSALGSGRVRLLRRRLQGAAKHGRVEHGARNEH